MSKTRFYTVRPGLWLHGVSKEPIGPGTVVELTEDQAQASANQIEDAPKGSKPGEKVNYAVVPDETAAEAPPEPVEPVEPVVE